MANKRIRDLSDVGTLTTSHKLGVDKTGMSEAASVDVQDVIDLATAGNGTMAAQDADAVAITGGTISGITDLAVADGGTGASTAAGARTNLGLGTVFADGFDGASLDSAWHVLRRDDTGLEVSGGVLALDTLAGSLYGSTNTAPNVALYPSPDGAWTATVTLVGRPSGLGQTAGLLFFVGNQRLVMLYRQGRGSNTTRTGLLYSATGDTRDTGYDYSDAATSSLPQVVHLRLDYDGEAIAGYTSSDGTTWTLIGRPAKLPGSPVGHVGVVAYDTQGATPVTVTFDDFELATAPGVVGSPSIEAFQPWVQSEYANAPAGSIPDLVKGILQQSDKYAVNTWYPATFVGQTEETYLDFGGTEEDDIRPSAAAAYALAVSFKTGAYSAVVAGSTSATQGIIVQLVRSLAYRHLANQPGGWGEGGQTALWAALAAQAGWIMWDKLTAAERDLVYRMLVHEADYRLGYPPLYWRDRSGTEVYSGDSRSDDNSWNALILTTAAAIVRQHPRRAQWIRHANWMLASTYCTPSDTLSSTLCGGEQLGALLGGSNIRTDGIVVNHDIIHPDYSAAMCLNLSTVATYAAAGLVPPAACMINVNLVWGALSQVTFPSPPYDSPGGTVYVSGSADLYYPEGNDWTDSGVSTRVMDKAALDVLVSTYELDGGLSPDAATWAVLHLQAVADMQARSSTGQTYVDAGEDTYPGREQWVAMHAAWAWMALWVTSTGRYQPDAPPVLQQSAPNTIVNTRMASGKWYAPWHGANNSTALTNGYLRGARLSVDFDTRIDRLAVNVLVAGGTGAVTRLGIYRQDLDGTYNLVVDAGTVDATSTGAKELTVNIMLRSACTYWICAANQGAASPPATLRCVTGALVSLPSNDSTTILEADVAGIATTGITGALPATISPGITTQVPKVVVRAA